MGQMTRRFFLLTLPAFYATRGATADEAVDPAVKTTAETMKRLYDELMIFKGKAKFHEMGFGAGGPFKPWLDQVKALDAGSKGLSLLQSGFRAVPMDLYSMAMDYMRSGGEETQLTTLLRKDFQTTFERVASGAGT